MLIDKGKGSLDCGKMWTGGGLEEDWSLSVMMSRTKQTNMRERKERRKDVLWESNTRLYSLGISQDLITRANHA